MSYTWCLDLSTLFYKRTICSNSGSLKLDKSSRACYRRIQDWHSKTPDGILFCSKNNHSHKKWSFLFLWQWNSAIKLFDLLRKVHIRNSNSVVFMNIIETFYLRCFYKICTVSLTYYSVFCNQCDFLAILLQPYYNFLSWSKIRTN